MNVTYFASASGVDGLESKQCKTLLLKAGSSGPENFGLLVGCLFESLSKPMVHLRAAWLIKLTLGCNSADVRAGATAFGKPGLSRPLVVSDWRVDGLGE
jgi:hypothetical protein